MDIERGITVLYLSPEEFAAVSQVLATVTSLDCDRNNIDFDIIMSLCKEFGEK